MIYGFMTISRNQKLTAPAWKSRDSAQNSYRASVYKKIGFLRAIDFCRIFLGTFKNPFCLMKIVKPVNLCEIKAVNLRQRPALRIPLVSRHMKRIVISCTVPLKLFKKASSHLARPIPALPGFPCSFKVSRREQYLSAVVTIHASRHLGGTTVSGHMCFLMMSFSLGDSRYSFSAFFSAIPGW